MKLLDGITHVVAESVRWTLLIYEGIRTFIGVQYVIIGVMVATFVKLQLSILRHLPEVLDSMLALINSVFKERLDLYYTFQFQSDFWSTLCFINTILPVQEFALSLVAYSAVFMACLLYRFIKSWIPTLAG